MAVANLLRIQLHWSGYGEEGTIGMHLSGAPAANSDKLNDLADQLDSDYGDDADPSIWQHLQNMLTGAQTWDRIDIYQYATGSGAATSQGGKNVGHVGTAPNLYSGLQQAIAVTLETGAPGRSARGRIYLPGHCVQVQGANCQLSAGQCDTYGGTAASLVEQTQTTCQSKLESNDINYVVFSRARSSARKVTELRCDSRVDTQRRRAANQRPAVTRTFPGPD